MIAAGILAALQAWFPPLRLLVSTIIPFVS